MRGAKFRWKVLIPSGQFGRRTDSHPNCSTVVVQHFISFYTYKLLIAHTLSNNNKLVSHFLSLSLSFHTRLAYTFSFTWSKAMAPFCRSVPGPCFLLFRSPWTTASIDFCTHTRRLLFCAGSCKGCHVEFGPLGKKTHDYFLPSSFRFFILFLQLLW